MKMKKLMNRIDGYFFDEENTIMDRVIYYGCLATCGATIVLCITVIEGWTI